MSFMRYLEEKRYFILLHVTVMSFVAMMMIVSANGRFDAGDIIYTLAGCSVLAAVYLIGGFYYRLSHYRTLNGLIKSSKDDGLVMFPHPRNVEQRLYMELIKTLQQGKIAEAEKRYKEQKDYQDFIMSWIHEVKLPITACYMLIQHSADKSVDELSDKLEDEIYKIDHYVEQALYYSRIDSFSKDYMISEVLINRIVRSSVKKYAKLFVAKRIRFSMWNEEHWVHSDSKWLGFIIDQVITNSLKYTDSHGTIECSFEDRKEEKRLLIRDSGVGIQPYDLGRVFEKGFTGSTGRKDMKSTGMGLYLANQMAIKLGHRLSVHSKVSEYTEITIHFPKTNLFFHM